MLESRRGNEPKLKNGKGLGVDRAYRCVKQVYEELNESYLTLYH